MKQIEVIRQQDQKDCGIACLLSIIQFHGGYNNLENLRKLSGTNITGTTLLGLYQAAQQLGFNAEGCEADIEALLNHNTPCILHVTLENNLQHYVVYYGASPPTLQSESDIYRQTLATLQRRGKKAQQLIIGDPAKGVVYMQPQELEKLWQSKTCLILSPNEQFERKETMVTAKRKWFKELIQQDFPLLAIAALLGIAIAALGLTMSLYSQRLIDDILPKKQYTKLSVGIVLVFILLFAKEGINVLRSYLLLRQSKEFNIRIIDDFYNRLLKLPKSFFDTRKIGELTARLNDTSRIQRVISQIAGNILLDCIVVLVSVSFIFSYSLQAGLFALVAMPVFFLLIYLNNKKIMEGQRSIMAGYAMAEGNYISTLQGIEAIKNHNRQELFTATNNVIYQNFQDKIFYLGKIQVRLSFLANAFAVLLLCSLLFFLSKQVLQGHLKTGELIAILGMFGSLLPSVANLALLTIPLNEAKIAFDRMYEFTGINHEESGVQSIEAFESMSLTNIAFRFAGRSRILNDISFKVCKGEIIALMGENGCGKSTLTQILVKNYNQESGSIVVNNNQSLSEIKTESWRKLVATVPQQVHIFNASVLENIAFDDAVNQTQSVLNFLEEFGFDSFIQSLPQSYMTLVGEEGINLSGGQKQMVALARALYHKPQLLILDEATAAMDRESEQFVLHLLQKIKKDVAVIFITHRLHVLKSFCDRIYILENGGITSQGNHQNLLQTSNLYSRYWADLVS
jgi:ATP-binding cassette, subfamily C, bacteriocin exporter